MAAKLYRFHCTDGRVLVPDDRGRRLANLSQARVRADRVAHALMEEVERFDWSGWQVDVYDPKGRRVWARAFIDVDVTRAAA